MKPKVNNEAWIEAFNIYKATGEFGPPEEINHDVGDTRALLIAGRCAQMIDWGDVGPLSLDPGSEAIKNKMAAVIMPGTSRVLDTETGKLVDCTPEICPRRSTMPAPTRAYKSRPGTRRMNLPMRSSHRR
jgi:multiple sugar transport system substrate-binding protein